MKFGNFLFPDSRDPERDGAVIDETIARGGAVRRARHRCRLARRASFRRHLRLCRPDQLSPARWRSRCKRAALGFAVLQTSLHHPIRLAEQIAVLDNLTKGRLIVGLGRGSSYNIYDYQGFGIDHHEAQARLDEAEDIIVRAWTEAAFRHDGRFWQLDVPILRPRPYTKPHPPLIRGSSGDASLVELARQGKPFLMNVQSFETTRAPGRALSRTMREAGYDDAAVAAQSRRRAGCGATSSCAETDAEAERIALPAFETMTTGARRDAQPHLPRNRHAHRGAAERFAGRARPAGATACIYGSPATRRRRHRRARPARHRRHHRGVPAWGRCRTRSRHRTWICSCARSRRNSAIQEPDQEIAASALRGLLAMTIQAVIARSEATKQSPCPTRRQSK